MEFIYDPNTGIKHIGHNEVTNNNIPINLKRRRMQDDIDMMTDSTVVRQGKNFLTICSCPSVFQTEEYKPKGDSLYIPIGEDVMINMSHIDQVTFTRGSFFTGNAQGVYSNTQQGCAINLWRYDSSQRMLFISKSLLFTDGQVFQEVRECLQRM